MITSFHAFLESTAERMLPAEIADLIADHYYTDTTYIALAFEGLGAVIDARPPPPRLRTAVAVAALSGGHFPLAKQHLDAGADVVDMIATSIRLRSWEFFSRLVLPLRGVGLPAARARPAYVAAADVGDMRVIDYLDLVVDGTLSAEVVGEVGAVAARRGHTAVVRWAIECGGAMPAILAGAIRGKVPKCIGLVARYLDKFHSDNAYTDDFSEAFIATAWADMPELIRELNEPWNRTPSLDFVAEMLEVAVSLGHERVIAEMARLNWVVYV